MHDKVYGFRELEVSATGAGMRLDRFLAARFVDRSRTEMALAIDQGQVCDEHDRPLRRSVTVRAGQTLRLYIPGIAPSEPPPPMPPILWEDDLLAVVHKPARMLAHPSGTKFAWSLIRAAKDHWPEHRIDLVHRLDRDTSGALLLTKELAANQKLKEDFKLGKAVKTYEALCQGSIPWDEQTLDGPIAAAGGSIRIEMAVRADGLPARTDVTVLGRRGALTHVRCRLHTGRTHQIRVHLAQAGFPLLGDRLYALPRADAQRGLEEGWDDELIERAGAPRQALHAASLSFAHPDGGRLSVSVPMPSDMAGWWEAA